MKLFIKILYSSVLGFLMSVPFTAQAEQFNKVKKAATGCENMCDALAHAKSRVLHPTACVALHFDMWNVGAVSIEVKYGDGRKTFVDSKIVTTTSGNFCYPKAFYGAVYIKVCTSENGPPELGLNGPSAELDEKAVKIGLARKKKGWFVTLKGRAWQENHSS